MYIGIDIGGTFIKYGVIDENGEILEKSSLPTSHKKKQFFLDLVNIVKEYQKKYSKVQGVGISAPGIILKDGTMQTAGAIKALYGENLKVLIEEECKVVTIVENDANAAAIAEQWIGNAQGIQNYLCLVLGTGVGGGIIVNGELFKGAHGMAGEFGWMLVRNVPKEGSIEEASFNQCASIVGGLCFQYQKLLSEHGRQEIVTDARVIFKRSAENEIIAKTAIDAFFRDLSVGLMNLICSFDPELILIGGAISSDVEFMERVNQILQKAISRHESLAYIQPYGAAKILPTKLQNDSGMIGAVYQLHKEIQKRVCN